MAEKNKMTLTKVSDREFVLTREFNAPRHLVFDAYTQKEHVQNWWGPRCTELRSCEIDLRVGGNWRFVTRGPDGVDYAFNGTYREIDRPSQIVYTHIFEMFPDSVAIITVRFEEQNGKTKLIASTLHPTAEACAGHLGSGMEHGAAESYDQLEELLDKMM